MDMIVEIFAHKGIGVDCKLAGGLTVAIPPGGTWQGNLTGDQVGKIQAHLAGQEAHERLGPGEFGGKLTVQEKGYDQPPKGSKKWKAQQAEKESEQPPLTALKPSLPFVKK